MEFQPPYKHKRDQGTAIEQQVIEHLKKQGLKIIHRNFYSYFGEIDLIMQEKNALVFMEVRLRNNPFYADGVMSVDHYKQQKIIKAATFFLKKFPRYANMPCRFDVISVKDRIKFDIKWIKDAFRC